MLPSLEEVRKIRDQLSTAIKDKVAKLKEERFDLATVYDQEIAVLEQELRMLGNDVPQVRRITDITSTGENIYEWLRATGGVHSASTIKREVKGAHQAVLWVALAPYIESGRVIKHGMRRASCYEAAPVPSNPAECRQDDGPEHYDDSRQAEGSATEQLLEA